MDQVDCQVREKSVCGPRRLSGQGEGCQVREKSVCGPRRLSGQGDGCMWTKETVRSGRSLYVDQGQVREKAVRRLYGDQGDCQVREKAVWGPRRLSGQGDGCMGTKETQVRETAVCGPRRLSGQGDGCMGTKETVRSGRRLAVTEVFSVCGVQTIGLQVSGSLPP